MEAFHVNFVYFGASKATFLPHAPAEALASPATLPSLVYHYSQYGQHTWCDTARYNFTIDSVTNATLRPAYDYYQHLTVPYYAAREFGYTSFFDYTYGKHGSCMHQTISEYFDFNAALVRDDVAAAEVVLAPFIPSDAGQVNEVPVYVVRNAFERANLTHATIDCNDAGYVTALNLFYDSRRGYAPEPNSGAYDMCIRSPLVRFLSKTGRDPAGYGRSTEGARTASYLERNSIFIVFSLSFAVLVVSIAVFNRYYTKRIERFMLAP